MRYSSLLSILCAVGVIGSPLKERDYVTDLYIVTITRTVTDDYGNIQTIPYNIEEAYSGPTSQLPSSTHTIHHNHKGHKGHKGPASSTSSCPPSSSPPPPPPTSTTTVNAVAPVPATTSSSSVPPQNNYVAPPPSTSSTSTSSTVPPYVAPSQNNHLAASSSTAPAPASTPTDNSYQGQVLYHHNVHRSHHSASPLEWDSGLEACAQALANKCVYQHDVSISAGGQAAGYGQNIGYGVSADNIGSMITSMMYNDEMEDYPGYDQASPDMTNFDKWGHFSQMVWNGTAKVGCVTVVCQNLGNAASSEPLPFTVCNFSPAGNVDTEYGSNVGAPLGHPYIAG